MKFDSNEVKSALFAGMCALAIVGLTILLVIIAGCGGGGSSEPEVTPAPPPVNAVIDWRDYSPGLVKPLEGDYRWGSWRSTDHAPGGAMRFWYGDPNDWPKSPSVEQFSVRADDWLWLDKYPHVEVNLEYKVTTDWFQYTVNDLWVDYALTPESANSGQPYLKLLYTQPYEVRGCGKTHNDPRNLDPSGITWVNWCWAAKYSTPQPVLNDCWRGTGPRLRLAVQQIEMWCDNHTVDRAWRCTIGDAPRRADGSPDLKAGVIYGRHQWLGLNAGANWQFKDYATGSTTCLINVKDVS